MTRNSFVPTEFCDSIIVPLLKCKHAFPDMYRGITLSSVLSKLFDESVLLDLFGLFLTSSDLQFGFKNNLGYSHALFAFNETVRYFMNNNSRAFGALDKRTKSNLPSPLKQTPTSTCLANFALSATKQQMYLQQTST